SEIRSQVDFTMDHRVLAYIAVVSIGTGILFGLAPALRLSKLDLNAALKDGGRASGGPRTRYLSGLLVVTEMGLAVVLLAGAGLMIRSVVKIGQLQIGVNTANVLTMHVDLPDAKYPHPEDEISFHQR